ncbi:diacylglycerol kinase delta isoform X1, partial [Lates japonicus]
MRTGHEKQRRTRCVQGLTVHLNFMVLFEAAVLDVSIIFDEVDLADASVAESSTKNVNNSFTL